MHTSADLEWPLSCWVSILWTISDTQDSGYDCSDRARKLIVTSSLEARETPNTNFGRWLVSYVTKTVQSLFPYLSLFLRQKVQWERNGAPGDTGF